jgi:hypothetical protein
MQPTEANATTPAVLIRDLMIFQLKLVLDGLKDAIVIPVSAVLVMGELLFGGAKRGRSFYALLRACEAFDRWLNLHGASRRAAHDREGLFGGSEPGDGTMLGELEGLVARRRGSGALR